MVERGHYNRNRKKGCPCYCSKDCAGFARRKDAATKTQQHCSSCGEIKAISDYRIRKSTRADHMVAASICKKCEYERNSLKRNPERTSELAKKRRKTDPEWRKKRNEMTEKWRKTNTDKNKRSQKNWHESASKFVTDAYVRHLSRGKIKKEDKLSSYEIEVERAKILSNRIKKVINQKRKGNGKKQTD